MDLSTAIEHHAAWKIRFRSAIAKQEAIDARNIGDDRCCELGKWLHGEGKTRFGTLPSHDTCVQRHAAFHTEAAKIAQAINARRFAEAEALLGSGSAYGNVSSAVGVALLQLKKDAKL